MILKEYDLPFHTFMGGWQTDDKVIDDMMNYYDLNKENAIPGHSYDPELKKSSIKKEYKDSKDLYVNCEANYWPITSYLNLLGECTKKYLEKYTAADEHLYAWSIVENFNIQRYPIGGGFKEWHCERPNPSSLNRILVFMTYLNSCDGGTEFKNQDITIPATKGLTLIWPSDWTHIHRGVVSHTSEKTIVTGWFGFREF